jgi:hypothetical protein
VFIACTLLHDGMPWLSWTNDARVRQCGASTGIGCSNAQPQVLREIKERGLVLPLVATGSPIAESACPVRSALLHSRIFAGAQAAAAALHVDVHRAAEFKWQQASNPAGAVR